MTMMSMAASSRSRQPVPDKAEFSPEVAAMLRSRGGRAELASLLRRRDEAIRMKLRKHLLALGWTIVSTPNSVMAPRLRYDSPLDGKSYVSLPLLVETATFHALEQLDQNPSPPPPSQPTHHHEQEDDDDDEEEDDDKDQEYTVSESDNDGDDDVILPAHTDEAPEQADAIAEYIECMEEHGWAKKSARAARLRASAKSHLESAGWTFWMKLKSNGREELRYRAPTGRSYISLLTACVAFRDAAAATAAAPTPKPTSSNERKRLRTTNPATILRVLRPRISNGSPGKTSATDACSESSTVVNSPALAAETTGENDDAIKTSSNKRKAPDELGYAADGTVVKKFFTTKRRKISELFSAKDAVIKKCTTTKQRRTSELLCADGTLIKKCTTTTTTSKKKKKKKKPKKKAAAASKARVLRPRGKDDGAAAAASPSACHRRSRTLLSVLMDKNILLPRDKLAYKETRDGPPVKEGIITGDGVKCACCNRAFTVAEFEAHATRRSRTDHPWSRVFLKDGRSLAQCLLQLMRLDGGMASNASLRVRRKEECTDPAGDSVCSICNDGGELVLCDHCPSTFHHDCLGLDAVPDGDWFCPSCRCSICGRSDFDPDAAAFTDKTIMYCDQCEREYHVGCVRDRGDELSCCPQGPWLCSTSCSKIFEHLQLLVGRSMPISVEGLKLTFLRSTGAHDRGEHDEAAMAEQHGKLCAALDVLHECFVTLIEPRTQSDLSADIVFNRESELRRLNFRGYYMIGLEKGGELITVGTLRVYGNKVAELPLVGTRFAHRRQGMCHLLMNELEKMLCGLGVERLVLPAVPELLQTWTGSFGFRVMTHSDKLEIAEHTILSFQGTTMCHKFLSSAVQ